MRKVKKLLGKQKARIITLAMIVLYLLYVVIAYVWDARVQTPQIEYVDSMQVDGSEFAPIANLLVAGANGFVGFLNMILSVVAIFVIALLLLVPWRCIAIRKNSVVTELEWKAAKYLLIGFTVLSVGVGLIMLRFTNLIYLLLLTMEPALFIWLLAFLPIRSAYFRTEDSGDDGSKYEQQQGAAYNLQTHMPVVKCSICNGEQVAGFKDRKTGHFTEIMLIQSEKDLEDFKERYGVKEVVKEY